MKKRGWRRNRRIIPLLLSLLLAVEPVGTAFAQEDVPAVSEGTDQMTGDGARHENDAATGGTSSGDTSEDGQSPESGESSDDDRGGVAPGSGPEEEQPDDNDPQLPDENAPNEEEQPEEGQPGENASDEEEQPEENASDEEEPADEAESESDGEELIDEEGSEPEEEGALIGFTGMPSSYELTSEQKAWKKGLQADLSAIEDEMSATADYIEDELVTLADSREEAELFARAYDAEIISYEYGVLVLRLTKGNTVKSALTAAADIDLNMPAVWPNCRRYLYGEEEELSYADVLAYNDPYLQSVNTYYQWHHTVIGSPYAWAQGYTGKGVKVAVLDSGIVSNSNDLPAVTSIYKEGNTDTVGHGTHVAGIIGAVAGNGKCGAGVAPGVTLYSGRIAPDGSIASSDLIAAIRAACTTGVDLINLSIGGPTYSSLEQTEMTKAYEQGIAVFASAGNDGGQSYSYPACYDHVISVGATDKGNERASFSTYSNRTDISAPGVAIWSTGRAGGDSYVSMSGTSMACPVAVGEAAVILGSYQDLPAKGPDRVDKLESLMKANTIKAGSGMGAGIVSLTKVFGLKTAEEKPDAPVITVKSADNEQSVTITITAQSGTEIYYTTNGKSPVYKDGACDSNTKKYTGQETITFSDLKAAKGTVKAIAVNGSGVVSKAASCSFTLKPYVTDIEISGPQKVEAGKSIQLSAAVTPSYASNKGITWSVQQSSGEQPSDGKVSVSAAGKVTVQSGASGSYYIIAAAKDGSGVSAKFEIRAAAAGAVIQKLTFDAKADKEVWITPNTSAPVMDLTAVLTAQEKNDAGEVTEATKEALKGKIIWTSNKPAIAAVDADGQLTAKSAGSVTITAKANDSGNKKATFSVKVMQAVTGITITTAKGGTDDKLFTVGAGKSLALKAAIQPAKPANKKILWSISPANPNVTISSSGKVSVKASATEEDLKQSYTVTAAAADGKGAVATQTVKVWSGTISAIRLDETKATIYQKAAEGKPNTVTIHAQISGSKQYDTDAWTVTNSNPAIVNVSAVKSEEGADITVTAAGGGFGKAKIEIASTDGSSKKASCSVTVSGGIKKVELREGGKKVSKLTMLRKCGGTEQTKQLTAYIEAGDGANPSAYRVSSSAAAIVSAELSGGVVKLTPGSGAGTAKITLEATDGSKKKAVCTVTVVNPVSGITIAPSAGNGGYIVQGKSLQLKARVESEYGAVSNKKVKWELYTSANVLIDKALEKTRGIKISSSGKITADKKAIAGSYKAVATAMDGSGVQASYGISLASPATLLMFGSSETASKFYKFPQTRFINAGASGSVFVVADGLEQGGFSVSSSNPAVASVTFSQSYTNAGTLYIVAHKKGSTSVTIKAMDGSGLQGKLNIRVR